MREQTQCATCDLVQFRTERNECRRCRMPLPDQLPMPTLKPDPPPLQIPPHQQPPLAAPLGTIPPLEETVRMAVLDALDKCEGNVMLAAKCLGIGKTTLYRYLRRWGPTSSNTRSLAIIKKQEKNRPTSSFDAPEAPSQCHAGYGTDAEDIALQFQK